MSSNLSFGLGREVLRQKTRALSSFGTSGEFGELLQGLVVRGTHILRKIEVQEFLGKLVSPETISLTSDETAVVVLKMLPVTNTTISVSNISNRIGTSEERNLRETVVMSIQGLSLERSHQVISDDGKLVPTSPEGLGGR